MHKAKNIYFLSFKKKRDDPRQGVAQGRVSSPKLDYRESVICIKITGPG